MRQNTASFLYMSSANFISKNFYLLWDKDTFACW